MFFDFATKKSKNITPIDLGYRVPRRGFEMSPDEKWTIYTRVDEMDSDIMLVENFRGDTSESADPSRRPRLH